MNWRYKYVKQGLISSHWICNNDDRLPSEWCLIPFSSKTGSRLSVHKGNSTSQKMHPVRFTPRLQREPPIIRDAWIKAIKEEEGSTPRYVRMAETCSEIQKASLHNNLLIISPPPGDGAIFFIPRLSTKLEIHYSSEHGDVRFTLSVCSVLDRRLRIQAVLFSFLNHLSVHVLCLCVDVNPAVSLSSDPPLLKWTAVKVQRRLIHPSSSSSSPCLHTDGAASGPVRDSESCSRTRLNRWPSDDGTTWVHAALNMGDYKISSSCRKVQTYSHPYTYFSSNSFKADTGSSALPL